MSITINQLISNVGVFVFDLQDIVNIQNLGEQEQSIYNNLFDQMTLKLMNVFGIVDPSTFTFRNILDLKTVVKKGAGTSSSHQIATSDGIDSYKKIIKYYNIYKNNLNEFYNMLAESEFDANEAYEYINSLETTFHGQRISFFRDLLGSISNSNNINVVVSFLPMNGTIAGALSHLIIGRFSYYVEPDDVYYLFQQNKLTVYEQLSNRYKQNILIITTSDETMELCINNGFKAYKIETDKNIFDLRRTITRRKPIYLEKRCRHCRKFFSYKNFSTHENSCKEKIEEDEVEATCSAYLR